jgi:hypothetical protein
MKMKQLLRTNSKCYGDILEITELQDNQVTHAYTVALRYNAEKPSEKELAYLEHMSKSTPADIMLPDVVISGAHFIDRVANAKKLGQRVYEINCAVDPLIDPASDAPIVRKRGRKPLIRTVA